jgi:toxin ParE1/3/4
MSYRLAPQAETDLEDIAFYIFLDCGSQEIAERLIDSITERFDLLDAYPSAGRRRDDLRPGYRAFPVGKYLIFYRMDDNGTDVVIARVVRGSRDLEALLSSRRE